MATLNMNINIPDAQMPRIQAAARATYGQVPDGLGGMREMTNPELTERMRQDFILTLKGMVQRYERQLLVQQAEAPITDVDAT